jgi:hypothetical protein
LRGRVAEVAGLTVLATMITVAMAAPVLRAPSERVFGMEIVGRHYDPFLVMDQFRRPFGSGVYSQPVTDLAGALLARMSGVVAAYNWLVLLSFPLSAAAAYLLARCLQLSRLAAATAAVGYAFSPFHIAHAAYHPHIAQTQWLPLYLLALWRGLDRPSPAAVALLGLSAAALALSNFYAGFIAAVITPVALAAYWLAKPPADRPSMRGLGTVAGTLVLIATGGLAYAWYAAESVLANPASFAFPRGDLFRYSAKWWSYVVPPVEHPLIGATVHRLWNEAGVAEGLLEQQVSLGWGVMALGAIAIFCWARPRSGMHSPALTHVPALVITALVALLCSLSPERTVWGMRMVRPSAILYELMPMFRSYARFGVVVQLMAVLLAGIGLDSLRRVRTRRTQIVGIALVALAAGEYVVWPPALWRDALPTSAHRWVMDQPGSVRALDCSPYGPESASVPWLTDNRVTLLGAVDDCFEPDLPQKLAATGYTHLLVRRHSPEGRRFATRGRPDGLELAAGLQDGDVFAVLVNRPAMYIAAMSGFFPREYNDDWTWRWMGGDAAWGIVNTTSSPVVATVRVELSAVDRQRRLDVRLDGRAVQTLVVDTARRIYELGPLAVPQGHHQLAFHSAEAPAVPINERHTGHPRALSFAFGTWSWHLADARQ